MIVVHVINYTSTIFVNTVQIIHVHYAFRLSKAETRWCVPN